MPETETEWIEEIAKAHEDAREIIAFGDLIGQEITEEDLFHLAPHVCMKFRGVEPTEENKKQAVETALQCYVANEHAEEVLGNPIMAFAFCYIVAHWGLDLIDEAQCRSLLVLAEEKLEEIEQAVHG